MKALAIGALLLVSNLLNAQHMNTPNEAVISLFIATDQQNWEQVEQIFAPKVLLDYSSMSGNPAASLAPTDITTAWKGILPGFESTHHQLGNIRSTEDGNKATVFCYGTATHYLTNDAGNVWTVVGSYDFELAKSDKGWQITAMTFHFKYQDGNTALPGIAMEALK